MEAYLDNSATTRAYPEVGDLVYKVMCQDYGNPSSMHRKGVDAEHYVKEAKETIAKVLKVNAKDIYFTSGGTESDNLALIGCARANRRAGNHLITTSIEHPAILNTMRYLEEEVQHFVQECMRQHNFVSVRSESIQQRRQRFLTWDAEAEFLECLH